MKSIIYCTVNKNIYKLGFSNNRNRGYTVSISFNNDTYSDRCPMDIYYDVEDKGEIYSTLKFSEFKILKETDKFHRVLFVEEKIKVDGIDHIIKSITHDTNGDIHYFVHYTETIDDEESKNKANEDLARRTIYLKGRADQVKYDIANKNRESGRQASNEYIGQIMKESEPKWYQFWK